MRIFNQPKITLIAAMAHNRVVGSHQRLPWRLPADLAHFKKITMGKPVVMGRKTLESIGRPLPGRENVVLSRQTDISIPGCKVAASLEEALLYLRDHEEIMIIGGGHLFEQALPLADRLILTMIDLDIEGDTFFPEWSLQEWQAVERESHLPDEKNPYSYEFVEWQRVLKDSKEINF